MNRKILAIAVLFVLSLGVIWAYWTTSSQPELPEKSETALTVSYRSSIGDDSLSNSELLIHPPVTYHNLQIFPISLQAQLDNREYVTLADALEKEWVVLRETGNVSELQLDNLSKHYIFIQSGDIVKGGRQDRTMQFDVIVPPLEKDIPIASFCVEAGRWSGREDESPAAFSISEKGLSSKSMKLYAKKEGDQGKVWRSVAKNQEKLTYNVSDYFDTSIVVNGNISSSSLQLTLENKALDSLRKIYAASFEKLIGNTEYQGLAYAINGRVFGIELYNNSGLYRDLSAKCIESFIIEAVSLRDSFGNQKCDERAVQEMLAIHQKIELAENVTDKKVNSITRFKTLDFVGVSEFITTDLELGKWLHINFLDERDDEGTAVVEHGRDRIIRGY
ncbi:MAG: hypothetical protein H6606_08575 [Flavobacteriales bacterium]|nr:hypothetical protein [Flavobacteriales bacterium]